MVSGLSLHKEEHLPFCVAKLAARKREVMGGTSSVSPGLRKPKKEKRACLELASLLGEKWLLIWKEEGLGLVINFSTKMEVKKERRIYITGLTAIGKTKLSIKLSQHIKTAEIINSDSQQFYKDANIMTATVNEEEQDGVPHHLLSFLDVFENTYNVRIFKTDAERIIQEVGERGNTPVIVGGTNYYMENLIYDLKEDPVESDLEKRHVEYDRIQAALDNCQAKEMFELLEELAPEISKTFHQEDGRRLENALKRIRNGQNPSSSWGGISHEFILIALDTDNTDWIESRISKRVSEMVLEENGLEECFYVLYKICRHQSETDSSFMEKIENLTNKLTSGVLQSIGYKEFIPLFQQAVLDIYSKEHSITEESLQLKAKSIMAEKGPLLDYCLNSLIQDTILLTKKQRKWMKNRLFSNPRLQESTFHILVDSIPHFFDSVLPTCKELVSGFLEDHLSYAELNKKFSKLKPELISKEERIERICKICDFRLIGNQQYLAHINGRKHKQMIKKIKKQKATIKPKNA